MSVLGLVLLSMTPIAAMGILLGLGRFEQYVLEGDQAGDPAGLGVEASQAPDAAAVVAPTVAASGVAVAIAAEPVAHATRPAA